MTKIYRGKLEHTKRLFHSGTSKVVILPITFLHYLDIDRDVIMYLNPADKSIIIKKLEVKNEPS